MEAKLKVSRALTRLACEDPFFGSCALRLDVRSDDSITTACTNGKAILWNTAFIDSCSEQETVGLICHEILHVLFMHCVPLEGKNPVIANIAMDFIINEVVQNECNYQLPKEGIVPEARFKDMTWQQVYSIIEQEEKYQKMASNPSIGDLFDHIDSNADLSDADKAELKADIEQMATQAAENAAKKQGNIPGQLKDLIDKIRAPKVDWKEVLENTLRGNNPDDQTWKRPNRKMLGTYDIYMPSPEYHGMGNIVVGLDTSGSVSNRQLESFLAELNSISQSSAYESITILYNDSGVSNATTFTPGDDITELHVTGRGGTCFKPVFEYVEEKGLEIDQMIYFSDMIVSDYNFPAEAPYYPVLWCSTGAQEAPFGKLIDLRGI